MPLTVYSVKIANVECRTYTVYVHAVSVPEAQAAEDSDLDRTNDGRMKEGA